MEFHHDFFPNVWLGSTGGLIAFNSLESEPFACVAVEESEYEYFDSCHVPFSDLLLAYSAPRI